jgi:hypothetical protein
MYSSRGGGMMLVALMNTVMLDRFMDGLSQFSSGFSIISTWFRMVTLFCVAGIKKRAWMEGEVSKVREVKGEGRRERVGVNASSGIRDLVTSSATFPVTFSLVVVALEVSLVAALVVAFAVVGGI